jgi:hypothetical protein
MAKRQVPMDTGHGDANSVYPNKLSVTHWDCPTSKCKNMKEASARLGPVACNSLQKFSTSLSQFFSTSDAMAPKTERLCSHSSTPPIRFVSFKPLRRCRTALSNSALCNCSNKSPTVSAPPSAGRRKPGPDRAAPSNLPRHWHACCPLAASILAPRRVGYLAAYCCSSVRPSRERISIGIMAAKVSPSSGAFEEQLG